MIHGDIDLTENLDFYRDRKEKDYKNTKDLSNKLSHTNTDDVSDNTSIIWTSRPNMTSSSYTFTYNNISNNLISDIYWNNYYLIYDNISDAWDFDDTLRSNNTATLSVPSPQNITYNISTSSNSLITLLSMNCTPADKKSNQCTKLFGEKPVKEYSNYKVIRKLSNKPKKEYKNSGAFNIVRLSRLYSNIVDRYNTWQSDWRDEISSDIDYIFGDKHELNKKYAHRFSPVPWLEDFASRHRSLYEDYMEELKGNERDNDSYLTDYGWLRIH